MYDLDLNVYNLNDVMQAQAFARDSAELIHKLFFTKVSNESPCPPKLTDAKNQFALYLERLIVERERLEHANVYADAVFREDHNKKKEAHRAVIRLSTNVARHIDQIHQLFAGNDVLRDSHEPVIRQISEMLAKHKPFIEKIDGQFKASEADFQSGRRKNIAIVASVVTLAVLTDVLTHPDIIGYELQGAGTVMAAASLIKKTRERRAVSDTISELNERLSERGIELRLEQRTASKNPSGASR